MTILLLMTGSDSTLNWRAMPKSRAKTRKDKLRIGRPYWLDTARTSVRVKKQPTLTRYDVIVAGAGISGALVAEAMSRAGKSVLVVDRRDPIRGSTAASTAMIQHEIDVPLTTLRAKLGAARADAAWLRSVKAVNDLITLTRALRIDCRMEPKPALYLSGNAMDGGGLEREAQARRDIGITAKCLDRARLQLEYGINREAAILSQNSASANPAQLTAGLLRAAQGRGAEVVSPVEVTDMAEMPGGVALATSEGRIICADHAVFCTGYEYLSQMRSASHHVTSTWAIATAPVAKLPPWVRETIVWEAADPYLYFRTDRSRRIIAGGEDEDAPDRNADAELLGRKATAIARKVEELTGLSLGPIDYRWSAPFSVSKDGLPIIDRVKGFDRVFAVMGFGGNGITFSMIAAQIVTAAILGKSDPDAHIFKMR